MKAALNKLWTAHSTTSIPYVRTLAVVALCVFFLTSAFTTWLEYWLLPEAVPPLVARVKPKTPNLGDRETIDSPPSTEDILSRNIFGGDPRETAEKEQTDDMVLERIPLAKNLQNYVLVGTIVNENGENFAVITDKRKREQLLLQEGDRLEEARITRILRNNVIIQRDNQEQMLSIDYSARNLMQTKVSPAEQSAAEEAPDTMYVDIDKDFVQKSLSNLQGFMQQAQIVPYMQDGRPAGYQLKNIQPGSAFDKLGLQDGDVIVSLNGDRIESPNQLMAFREELTNTDQASLQILRNGNTVDIEYSLN